MAFDLKSQVQQLCADLINHREVAKWTEAWLACHTGNDGSENLLWRYGQQACASGNDSELRDCQATLENLLEKIEQTAVRVREDKEPKNVVQTHMPGTAWSLLKGAVKTIQAAAARRVGANDGKYLEEASASYQMAFARPGSAVNGRTIADRAVDRLLNQTKATFTCQTWFLLTGTVVKAVRLTAELEPGQTGQLLPDPILIGCVGLNEDFLLSIDRSWQFVQNHWPCPAGHRVVWGLAAHQGINLIDGDSGGASLAAVFRGAIENIPLDTFVAASATLDLSGTLGKVDGGDNKRIAAMQAGCDQVLYHPQTRWDSKRAQEGGRKLPKVDLVTEFNNVWESLSAMERCIRAYQEHWRNKWEEEWPVSVSPLAVRP